VTRPLTNSEVTTFSRCERLWHYTYEQRRVGFERPEVLNRGTRIHDSLAAWWSFDRAGVEGVAWPHPFDVLEGVMMCGYHASYNNHSFTHVQTNVPFIVRIGFVDMVGEVDALAVDADGQQVIIEHKSTSHDIAPGSAWWRERITCDTQPTVYSAAFPGAKVMYDVLHVPDMSPLKATPADKRRYTRPSKYEAARLYAGQRERDETDDEYMTRVLSDMAERPEKYFQRAYVVRMETDLEAYAEDLYAVTDRMHGLSSSHRPRNAKACHAYGRPCEFLAACWQGKSIEDYPQVEMNHSETIVKRLEMYKGDK
jgi:hypothetical protein